MREDWGAKTFLLVLSSFYIYFIAHFPPSRLHSLLSFYMNIFFVWALGVLLPAPLLSVKPWYAEQSRRGAHRNDSKWLRREIVVSSSIKCAKGYVSCCLDVRSWFTLLIQLLTLLIHRITKLNFGKLRNFFALWEWKFSRMRMTTILAETA